MKVKFKEIYSTMTDEDSKQFWCGYSFLVVGLMALASFVYGLKVKSYFDEGSLYLGLFFFIYGAVTGALAIAHGHEVYDEQHEHDNDDDIW
jgi:uncharacterized membrane-anchored protein